LIAITHIDSAGHLTQTQSSTGTPNWSHLVAVGNNLVFYRDNDGLIAITHIDSAGHLTQTQSSTGTPNWSHLVAVG
ncbi:hypothetical protein AB0M22_22475, partial [Nocardia sp. NPDC051756]|uniref:hypothetical protein n=1 Tax=Nocardia sp. NPDC051756 TaxID=3154751 RepID=UPI00341EDA11